MRLLFILTHYERSVMSALEKVRNSYSELSDSAAVALMTLCLYGSLSRDEIEEYSGLSAKRTAVAVNELRLAKLIDSASDSGPIKDVWHLNREVAEAVKEVSELYSTKVPKGHKRDTELAQPKLGLKKKLAPQIEVKTKHQALAEKCLSVAEIAEKDQAVPMNSTEFLLGRYYLGLLDFMGWEKEDLFQKRGVRVLSDKDNVDLLIKKFGAANTMILIDQSFSGKKSQISWMPTEDLLNLLTEKQYEVKVRAALGESGKSYKHDEQASWKNDSTEIKATRC